MTAPDGKGLDAPAARDQATGEAPATAGSPVPDRNTLALDRTVLANERTYQAWLRTGTAALAAGLGTAKFLQEILPLWILLLLTSIMILFSTGAFLLAAWRYTHLHLRMAHLDADTLPPWMVRAISILLAVVALVALGGVLITIGH